MSDEHPLQIWRRKRKMTQTAFGALIGIGASQVSQIENRERGCSLGTALAIHKLTKVPLENLLLKKEDAA